VLSFLAPFLCSGVVSANFHLDGTIAVEKDMLNTLLSEGANVPAHLF
jgi:hypothetical protein